jgi:hypothetical protein
MPSTGDSVKLSSRLGVDAQDMPCVLTLPKRKGGSNVSVLVVGLCCGIWVVDLFERVNEGRVTGRLRL